MERRFFILLILLVLSVILNIYLLTKNRNRQVADNYHELQNTVQNTAREYGQRAERAGERAGERVRNSLETNNNSSGELRR